MKLQTKFKTVTLFPIYIEEFIPEDWSIDKINHLVQIIDYRGRTPPISDKGIIHLRSNNIRSGRINFDDLTYVSEKTYDQYMTRGIPQENDVLFTTEGPLGEVALVPKNFKFSLAQRIILLRPKSNILLPQFLKWILLDRKVRTRYFGLSTGTTLEGIASKWFTKLFIPYPRDLKEQQKIASILSNVDELIQKTEQIIEQTQRLKKGLMQRLLTKGIGHIKFKKTELGIIPEEWNLDNLDNLLNLCQYGLSLSLSEKGEYPIFRMNNIENGYMISNDFKYIDLDRKTFEQFKLEKNDVLINRTNSIDLVGKLGIFLFDGDYTFASYLIRMRTKKEKLNPFFLNFFLNTEKMQYKLKSLATPGVSQANINATNLKSLIIPIPSLSEQEKIISIIRRTDHIYEKQVKEKDILSSLKKGLMQQLLTGKIRVKV